MPQALANVSLDDKYAQDHGRVFLTGNQALVRLLLLQRQLDVAAGLNTAGFVSGYRGSPLGGYDMDPAEALGEGFEDARRDMVVVRGIAVHGVCPHHLVPFRGVAHVAYLPGEHVVGLSKLARLVDAYARRFQVQEKMTAQIGRASCRERV